MRDLCEQGHERIRLDFEKYQNGRATVRDRAALVDSVTTALWRRLVAKVAGAPASFCLAALGGYGRATLFPGSDIDLLFLSANPETEAALKDAIRCLCQEMWDLRLRVSHTTRSLAECGKLHPDNIEFTISLLDSRCLAGDRDLFNRLQNEVLPQLVVRERQRLLQRLVELTRDRHARFGNTIFHLEPNLKEGPGGLRDFHVATWLAQISGYERRRSGQSPESLFPALLRDEASRAVDFLFSARCFLHYRAGRDDNQLSWEAQDAAAAAGVGISAGARVDTSRWMRDYFRHARAVDHLATHLLDDIPPARSNLYHAYQQWRSRLSNADFSVVQGRIYLQQPTAIADSAMVLRLFEFVARHGFKLSPDAELRVARALPAIASRPPAGVELWSSLREILRLPHAATALRTMHALGLLTVFLPELRRIDALVIRDFYHRYTVDEHTILTIETLHGLRHGDSPLEKQYTRLLEEVERRDLLFLALLLHDVGKGEPSGAHIEAGMPLVESAMTRLALDSDDRETVAFLVEQHLQMSMALMRRDIFDPETIHALANRIGTTDRLKMLCLVTYADVKAVNPEALTPWKAEDIWHLYVQTVNHLDRSVDGERVGARQIDQQVQRHLQSLPRDQRRRVESFVEGLPRRYLLTHSPQAIAAHADMASAMNRNPVQVALALGSGLHRLTVIAGDRSGLFASVTGVLTAWGMSIVKADAFSNTAGVVLDTFAFVDPFRTLELNPPERERFTRSLEDVLLGESSVEALMPSRRRALKRAPQAGQATRITVDNDSSSHSTILEVVAADRLGLLYAIASVLTENGYNIDVALVDTQGHVAIDVFYISHSGRKLDAPQRAQLEQALSEELSALE